MDWQLDKVNAQCFHFLAPPENIYNWWNKRNNCNAQIGQPGLSVTDRCKTQAVEQGTDADGREDCQGDGTKDRLKTDQREGCMADKELCHRKTVQHIPNKKAAMMQCT